MPILYQGVVLVQCAEHLALEQFLSAGLQRFVVRRLSSTCVVVDQERLDEVVKLFERLGQTPRIVNEGQT